MQVARNRSLHEASVLFSFHRDGYCYASAYCNTDVHSAFPRRIFLYSSRVVAPSARKNCLSPILSLSLFPFFLSFVLRQQNNGEFVPDFDANPLNLSSQWVSFLLRLIPCFSPRSLILLQNKILLPRQKF